MRGTAATGWGILIAALVVAALLSLGLYVWDSDARQAEVALRPQPAVPVAGPPSRVLAGLPPGRGGQPQTGDPSNGQKVFLVQCNACHPGASAGIGPPIRGPQLAERYPDDGPLAVVIRQGTGTMLPTPPDRLPDQELANVIAYLRGL
jgi:mono/diheme cytochrome c family protein